MGLADELTELERRFLVPRNSTHRQYEALRAYVVEGVPSKVAAQRFGYMPGAFRVLCHQFRRDPDRTFFVPPVRGPQSSPKKDRARDQVISLRKQNFSIYDIRRALHEKGLALSTATIATLLREEGFAALPRRRRAGASSR